MTHRRTGLPVEHPQRYRKRKTWAVANQPAPRKTYSRLLDDLFEMNIAPPPWVVLVKNPAPCGIMGVEELSCTTRYVLTALSATSCRYRSGMLPAHPVRRECTPLEIPEPDGPKSGPMSG